MGATGNKFPYQMAVEELHKVVTLYCPLEKLECLGMNRFYLLFYCLRWCLKQVCILICRCARASERSQSRVPAISRATCSRSRRAPATLANSLVSVETNRPAARHFSRQLIKIGKKNQILFLRYHSEFLLIFQFDTNMPAL